MEFWGIVVALGVAAATLLPFLVREMKKGSQSPLKPGTPAGAGDVTPGVRGDPAPGQPDAQADPWSPQAHRP
jgi:hypothetical protein